MFDVEYPGKCFGNFDEKTKECKRCKIKQYCKSPRQFSGKTGIEVLKDLANESGTVILKPNDTIRASFCFLHGSIDFMEDGSINIKTNGEDPKKISYVVSTEEAIRIFNSLI